MQIIIFIIFIALLSKLGIFELIGSIIELFWNLILLILYPINKLLFGEKIHFGNETILAIDYMDGHDFEYMVSEILKKNNFNNVKVTKGSRDYGIDIIANKNGLKYGFQCKRYIDNVGVKAVQETFAGANYYGCDVAVVITNSYFTKNAQELASELNVKLWNRDVLKKYINQANNQ